MYIRDTNSDFDIMYPRTYVLLHTDVRTDISGIQGDSFPNLVTCSQMCELRIFVHLHTALRRYYSAIYVTSYYDVIYVILQLEHEI